VRQANLEASSWALLAFSYWSCLACSTVFKAISARIRAFYCCSCAILCFIITSGSTLIILSSLELTTVLSKVPAFDSLERLWLCPRYSPSPLIKYLDRHPKGTPCIAISTSCLGTPFLDASIGTDAPAIDRLVYVPRVPSW